MPEDEPVTKFDHHCILIGQNIKSVNYILPEMVSVRGNPNPIIMVKIKNFILPKPLGSESGPSYLHCFP